MPQDPSPDTIYISPTDLERMRLDVASRAPEEACGLLAGLVLAGTFQVKMVIPATNELHSPVRYRMEPQEQIDAFISIEAHGLELVGIYHSHPAGPPDPSPTDLAEAFYPDTVSLIWSPQVGDWQCKAFRVRGQKVDPVIISVIGVE